MGQQQLTQSKTRLVEMPWRENVAVQGGAVLRGTAIRESATITHLWVGGRIAVADGWLGFKRTDREPLGLGRNRMHRCRFMVEHLAALLHQRRPGD